MASIAPAGAVELFLLSVQALSRLRGPGQEASVSPATSHRPLVAFSIPNLL